MRLIFLFIFAALMQVSAASFGQRVSLSEKNARLEQVLAKIKLQAQVKIVYADEVLKTARPVSLQLHNVNLEEALKAALANQQLEFSIIDQTVVIKEKKSSFLDKLVERFANIDVSGRVIDSDGNPIPGATITVKGIKRSVVSDGNGYFKLTNVDEKAMIVISYVGYAVQEFAANTTQPIVARLVPEVGTLDGMVVIGYGKTTKRTNTGSVSTITSKDIANQPVSNPISALQGRVAGLDISSNNGYAGSGMSVRLRGISSITGGRDPLYVVDGIPFNSTSLNQFNGANGNTNPLNSINPSDIDRIDILKDADATAIFGSRGANGVILITTKQGKSGKTTVDANVYSGISFVNHKVEMLSTEQYLALRREAFKNDGTTPVESSSPDLFPTWGTETDNNWVDKLIGNTAKMTEAQLSLSGGSEQTNFLFSGTYRNETTVVPGDQGYNRGAVNSSVNHKSADNKLNFNVSVKYVGDQNQSMPTDVTQYYNTSPNYPVYNADGSFYWPASGQNPMAYLERTYLATTQNLIGNVTTKYNIFKGLSAQVNLGYNKQSMKQTRTQPQATYNPTLYSSSEAYYGNTSSTIYNIEPQLDYEVKLSKAELKLLAGGTYQTNVYDGLYLAGSDYVNDSQLDNPSAAAKLTNVYSHSDYKYVSVFGRATYNWDGKYILNGSFRRDGSSRFGPGRRYGNFGSVGAAWLFTNEDFVKDHFSFLSSGKLRASYGTVGNDQIGNYGYYDSWRATDFTYGGVAGLTPSRFANEDFHWESTRKMDAAIELGFVKDRILFTANFYRNITTDALIIYPLSSQSGYTAYTANLPAKLQNKGFEFELTSVNIRKEDFKWNSSFNLTISRNKLIDYPGLANTSFARTYYIGQPINVVTGYVSTGINPQNGIPTFVDTDNSGTINTLDMVPIGNINPKFFGGLQNSFTYKNLSLDFLFQFAEQQGPLLNYGTLSTAYGSRINKDVSALDRWTTPGQLTSIPVATAGTTAANTAYNNWRLSSANWGDASYIRLKNVAIRYNLGTLLKNIKVRNVSVYVQGQNLFTITNYDGFDPETKGVVLPPLSVYTAGLQVSF